MPDDLSQIHEPVSDFLASTPSPTNDVLTVDQVEQFNSEGFLSGIPLLNVDQVDELNAQLQPLMSQDPSPLWHEFHSNESEDPDSVLFHALGAWRLAPGFHDLLWHPSLVGAAEQLLGGNVRFWHDQLFCKPAGHGAGVSWHQDYSYWTRTTPMAHLTCWIALDDTTSENGVIQYIPGSHRWNPLPITGLAGGMDAILAMLDPEQRRSMKNPAQHPIKKGECSFHHPLTVHGSTNNLSGIPRRATVVNLIRDGVESAADEPLLEGIPSIPPGEPLGGQFFPLLSR